MLRLVKFFALLIYFSWTGINASVDSVLLFSSAFSESSSNNDTTISSDKDIYLNKGFKLGIGIGISIGVFISLVIGLFISCVCLCRNKKKHYANIKRNFDN
jgi:hypothetical protein